MEQIHFYNVIYQIHKIICPENYENFFLPILSIAPFDPRRKVLNRIPIFVTSLGGQWLFKEMCEANIMVDSGARVPAVPPVIFMKE